LPIVIGGATTAAALGAGLGLALASNAKANDVYALQDSLAPSACASPSGAFLDGSDIL